MALTWPQGIKKIPITLEGHFATLGADVLVIKYCFDEIHTIGSK
jgi:hypothetical protein